LHHRFCAVVANPYSKYLLKKDISKSKDQVAQLHLRHGLYEPAELTEIAESRRVFWYFQ